MIPLVIALWEDENFSGHKRLLVEDTPNLTLQAFDNLTSAIGVHPGPDYAKWKAQHGREPTVWFYEHVGYGGSVLILMKGAYNNIHTLFRFGDAISSVKFNPLPENIGTIADIPLIVEVYKDDNYLGDRLVIVENSSNLTRDFGSTFHDSISSVKVKPGPTFSGQVAQLFQDEDFRGGHIDLPPGEYPSLHNPPYRPTVRIPT